MTHWGWYWNVKMRHVPRKSTCSSFWLNEIDSFDMYNNYEQAELVRSSPDKCSFSIPRYNLKAYLQNDDSLLVKYQHGTYVIPVERKPCNFGGFYYFFHCPACDKRFRKLYCLNGVYLCRKCGNLAYYKQRLRPSDRFLRMRIDTKEYIKVRAGNLELNKKPPRMHKKTFKKLKDRAAYYEAKWHQARWEDASAWYGYPEDPWFAYEWQYAIDEYEATYKKKN